MPKKCKICGFLLIENDTCKPNDDMCLNCAADIKEDYKNVSKKHKRKKRK